MALALGLTLAIAPITPVFPGSFPPAQVSLAPALSAPLAHAASSFDTTLTMPDNSLGLVGHWTFDGPDMVQNVADASGQGNNGYLVGATSTTPGVLGQALSFNGTNRYVDVPDSSSINITGYNITFSFWIKSDIAGCSSGLTCFYNLGPILYNKPGNGNNQGYDAYSNLNTMYFEAYNSSSNYCRLSIYNSNFKAGWNLLTFTQNSSGCVEYLNGVQFGGPVSPGVNLPGVATNLYLGANYNATSFLNGVLDDVRIYNRALSATEVAQLYREGVGSHQNTTITPPNLATGLVGHWTFDGGDMINNVADTSGNGNNGYLEGFTSTTTVPGVIGQALSFNGSTNYINTTGSFTAPFTAGAITESVWVRADSFPSSGVAPVIISTYGGVSNCVSSYIELGTSGTLGAGFQQLSTGSASLNTTISAGHWYHVAWTFQNGGVLTLYVNGVQVGQSVPTITLDTSSNPLTFGLISGCTSTNYFHGSIDDVRIYNRALSSGEIAALYRLGVGSHQNMTPDYSFTPPAAPAAGADMTTSLVGWWKFDDGSGGSAADSSGNGYTGTLVGGPAWTAGKIGGALALNGSQSVTTGYVQTSATAYTISAWINTSATNNFIVRDRGSSGQSLTFGVYWWGTTLCPGIAGGALSFVVDGNSLIIGRYYNGNLDDGKWHHVTGVFSAPSGNAIAPSQFSLYVDGVAVTPSGSCSYGSATSPLSGSGGTTIGGGFSGTLDDVRIYTRALSADDIYDIYYQGASTPPFNPEPGLVGHWTFDGGDMINNVADTSGNGNNGYLSGFTSTTTVPGVIGQALKFSSASGQYVDILSRNGFSIGSGSKWSFSAWVKPTAADLDSSYHMIVSYGQVGTGELPDIDINSGGHWAMSCYGGYSIADGATVKTGLWTHVVGTYDGTNMRLYLNGGLVSGPTAESGCAPTNASAAIGAQAGTGSFPFDGSLDDARVYDRALSASEVLRLYKLGK